MQQFNTCSLFLALLSSYAIGQTLPAQPQDYCITYYGFIQPSLDLANAAPTTSSDGSQTCPKRWSFDAQSGAILTICPPDLRNVASNVNIRAGAVLDISLSWQPSVVSLPIGGVNLGGVFITNGSQAGPYPKNAEPAVLRPNPEYMQKPYTSLPWEVTGTAKALVDSSSRLGLGLSCAYKDRASGALYCGRSSTSSTDDSDCWRGSFFQWNTTSNLDIALLFSSTSTRMELTTREEWKDNDGQGTGSFSTARVRFDGTTEFPSVVDYDFWDNSYTNYEAARREENPTIIFGGDEAGMPIFTNSTESGQKYFAANGTFTRDPDGVAGAARDLHPSRLVMAIVTVMGIWLF